MCIYCTHKLLRIIKTLQIKLPTNVWPLSLSKQYYILKLYVNVSFIARGSSFDAFFLKLSN